MNKCEIYSGANETETWGKPNMTDNDLADSGNMWQLKYQSAHRELVVANRAVQRLSARCKALREENKELREPADALTGENFDYALAAYQHKIMMVDKLSQSDTNALKLILTAALENCKSSSCP